MGESNPLLSVCGVEGEEQNNPQHRTLTAWENFPKQRPNLKSKKEADEQAKQLPCEWMSAKDGSRDGKDISQQRAEGAEAFDEFGGTEEAQEPREGKVVPVEAHPGREQAVSQHNERG